MSIESLNVGRGQGILSKEQIVGAFATAQHQHAVGFDLLMANTGTIARPNNGSAPRLQIG
ncbi:hypothetical protein [Dickeya zeae]|uniref:hypothetical protein n=1 Tax=Dickeya zeae TaxID=204042 RepID=UPI001F3F919F|nr:hypothetical protein [Dickeya zeae]